MAARPDRALSRRPAGARPRRRSPTQFALIAALYDEMLAHHGLRIGLRHARKHLGWALDAAAASAGIAFDTLKRWRGTRADQREPRPTRARGSREAYDAFACGGRGMSDAGLRTRRAASIGAADAVLNALPLPVIIVAADGKIADANVGGGELLRGVGAAAAPAAAARSGAVRQPAAGAGRAGAPAAAPP